MKEPNGVTHDIYPYECRMRNLTYSCSVFLDVTYSSYDITKMTREQLVAMGNGCENLALCEKQISRETLLCQIPCMLGTKYCHLYKNPYLSNECPFEQKGTFVVNGSDKVLISQEKLRTNHP